MHLLFLSDGLVHWLALATIFKGNGLKGWQVLHDISLADHVLICDEHLTNDCIV